MARITLEDKIFKSKKFKETPWVIKQEFETHENYYVIRAGIELEFEISNNWDLSPGLIYDLKETIYDSWTIGVAIGKRF